MKNSLSFIGLLIVSTLWATISFILPDFWDNPIHGIRSVLTIIVYLSALGIATFFVLLLGTLQRHIACIFLPLFALLGSIVAYYRVTYHATITPIIIEVTLQTNPSEIASVFAWQLVVYILLNILIASALVLWRWRMGSIAYGWVGLLIGLIGLPVYYTCNDRIHQSINQRYPYNIPYNLIQYYQLAQTHTQSRTIYPIQVFDSRTDLTIILVLGEAIRADHLSLNGYYRPTTPRLMQRERLINLGNVFSMHTHTSASLPHILTPADTLHPDYAYSEESLIYYLHKAGYRTAWLSNQDLTESYSHFAYSADTTIFPNAEKSVFVFDGWDDFDLLPPLSDLLASSGKQLYVLHTIGAHWYYNNHVTPETKVFLPTTTSRIVTENDPLSVINSYDNCIVTMDCFLDSLYSIIPNTPTVIIYQSDHGESLGENGNWLHAAGAEETKHPAGFILYNELFEKSYPELISYYQQLANSPQNTDYVFPLVLKTAGIELLQQ